MNRHSIKGLTSAEAKERLKRFGPNQIFKPKKISFWDIAWEEIREPMILLLLLVGVIYSIWGKLADALTIFVIIILLVLAEVWNEYRAKKAISSLEKIAAPLAKVFRNGQPTEVNSEEIVPGDLLILNPGTKIAADARLLKTINIEVDESALTGESYPQEKVEGQEIFAGTVVLSGEGEAEVIRTGEETQMGKVAKTLKEIKPPRTALQLAMRDLSEKLVYVALFFSILIPLIGYLRGQDLRVMILTGLSLAFATIPEELPIIITMVLGLGAYNLSRHNFLVKKINSAEVLGSATCIVTDKTGTLTEGKLETSNFFPKEKKLEILEVAKGAISEYSLSPLDQAIKEEAKRSNILPPQGDIFRQRDLGNGKKTKALIRRTFQGMRLFSSGAPEEIFGLCRDVPNQFRAALAEETGNGKRVIAVALKDIKEEEKDLRWEELEKDMELVGLVSFRDPPREKVKETIETARRAGIRTIMVTGDHPLTAEFVAKEVGISSAGGVLTGVDLDSMDDTQLREVVKTVSVFARATAQHKYRIVKALQENGEVVAVTGDGINDVLALKAANIGIAMGKKGTDVAKEAADIVLADDNYITITSGIFEGRKFFDNMNKGVKYYLAVKVALILIFLLPVIIGIPMPFAPIQIILLELFMDLAASAGFVAEPQEKGIYHRPPRNPKEPIFSRKVIGEILLRGGVLFLTVTAVYLFALYNHLDLITSQTFAFSSWIFGHIILAFISRSDSETVPSLGSFSNKVMNIWALAAIGFLFLTIYIPSLGRNLSLATIPLSQLLLILLLDLVILGLLELRKIFLPKQALPTAESKVG